MHFDLGSIIGLAATLIGGWIGTRIIRPRDHDRAADDIADGYGQQVGEESGPGKLLRTTDRDLVFH